jgi:hypothetical protein
VLLAIKATNSSSMARRQFGSTRAVRTEEGTGDKVDAEVADRAGHRRRTGGGGVDEAGDEGAAQVLAVGPPAYVSRAVGPPGLTIRPPASVPLKIR